MNFQYLRFYSFGILRLNVGQLFFWEQVSELSNCFLTPNEFFKPFNGENELMKMSALNYTNTLNWIFIVLAP